MNADPSRHHFHELTHDQQCEAVVRMADQGMTNMGIALATSWSVEYVQHVIGERETQRREA